MKIDFFLKKFIEGYIFEDLKYMSKTKSKHKKGYGEAGYPMLMTILAGIELLGALLDPKKFNTYDGEEHFEYYWKHFFEKYNPAYKGMCNLFRELIRDGLAHTFLAKPGIYVIKRHKKFHMTRDKNSGNMIVNSVQMYRDFKRSYFDEVKPLIKKTDNLSVSLKVQMQSQLDEISRIYSEQSNSYKGALTKLIVANTLMPPNSNASTSVMRIIQNFGTSTLE